MQGKIVSFIFFAHISLLYATLLHAAADEADLSGKFVFKHADSDREFASPAEACSDFIKHWKGRITFQKAEVSAQGSVGCFGRDKEQQGDAAAWVDWGNVSRVVQCPEGSSYFDSAVAKCKCDFNEVVNSGRCSNATEALVEAETATIQGKQVQAFPASDTRSPPPPRCPERTFFNRNSGATVIESQLAAPPGRAGLERVLPNGLFVGLPGWHRAHSQGQGTGAESERGILYAPPEVNLSYQARVENTLREAFEEKSDDENLCLKTETFAREGTIRLHKIIYQLSRVTAERPKPDPLFEVEIEVEDKRDDPKVWIR
jgi:hypothetical protein